MKFNSTQTVGGNDVGYALARDASQVSVDNTVTETTIATVTVPANALGTNRTVRVDVDCDYLNNTGATRNFILKIKFGGTTIYQSTTPNFGSAANRRAMNFIFWLSNQGATNSQEGWGSMQASSATTAPATGTGDLVNAAISDVGFNFAASTLDTTSSKDFVITITHSAADVSLRRQSWVAVIY